MNYFLAANSRQLVTRTRRGIEILDVIQGHHLWSIPRYSPTRVRTDRGGCDDDRLYRLWGPDLDSYSIRSGRPLEMPHILLDSIPWLTPLDQLGLTTLRKPRAGDGLTLKLEHIRCSAVPITGREGTSGDRWDERDLLRLESVWTHAVAADDWLGAGPPGHGVWIEKSGAVRLLDWATGRTQSLGTAVMNDELVQAARTRDEAVEVFAHWDRTQLVIGTSLSETEDDVDCPYIPAYGVLSVHSRDRSHPDWHATTKGILLTQSLARSPFLSILHLENLPIKDVSCQRVHLTLLDKQTGKVVHELRTPTIGTGASGGEYEPLSQRWSLYLPEERIRLQARAVPPP